MRGDWTDLARFGTYLILGVCVARAVHLMFVVRKDRGEEPIPGIALLAVAVAWPLVVIVAAAIAVIWALTWIVLLPARRLRADRADRSRP
jgi:hypothetical protein